MAKISDASGNILTTVHLLSDMLGASADPRVSGLAPKLIINVARAISVTDGALAFGMAEELQSCLNYIQLGDVLKKRSKIKMACIKQIRSQSQQIYPLKWVCALILNNCFVSSQI